MWLFCSISFVTWGVEEIVNMCVCVCVCVCVCEYFHDVFLSSYSVISVVSHTIWVFVWTCVQCIVIITEMCVSRVEIEMWQDRCKTERSGKIWNSYVCVCVCVCVMLKTCSRWLYPLYTVVTTPKWQLFSPRSFQWEGKKKRLFLDEEVFNPSVYSALLLGV